MDSKTVNRGIRARIRPVLEEAGFSAFTARNSWRYAADRIDVVNFQSYSAYNASVLGCTSYSFSVNLACYLPWVPSHDPRAVKEVNGCLRPSEYECYLRGRLFRQLEQPELASRDIWLVDPKGRYLVPALEDVRSGLLREGLAWFDSFGNASAVLRVFRDVDPSDALWGFGRNPSPMRSYLIGYAALRTGDHDLARAAPREALESGSFDDAATRIERDLHAVPPA